MSKLTLIERLRHFADAYPTDLWPPLTVDERAIVGPAMISRISADMARHNSKLMLEAAQALADAQQEESDNCRLIAKLGGLLTQSVDILRGPPGPLELWSTHDVPALCSMMMKHNARLGLYAKLTQNTLAMLADSARMMLELHQMEEDRATKEGGASDQQEAGAAARDVPGESVSADARPDA